MIKLLFDNKCLKVLFTLMIIIGTSSCSYTYDDEEYKLIQFNKTKKRKKTSKTKLNCCL
jgi:hypothetical protein